MSLLHQLMKCLARTPGAAARPADPNHAPASGGLMLALEPRLMYDASGVVAGLDVLVQGDSPAAGDLPGPADVDLAVAAQPVREVVFVDAGIPDPAFFAERVGPGTQVYLLRPGEEAIGQITATLAGFQNLQAVHIIAHGSPGTLDLGGSPLSLDSLPRHAEALACWSTALADQADLLLYGCEVGAGLEGQALLERLADLTGADVAASVDLTGAAAGGGDWTLEARVGTVDSDLPGPDEAFAAYGHLLAAPTVVAGGTLTVTEGDAPAAVAPALTVTDADDTHLESARIRITGSYQPGEDRLEFTDTGTITSAWDPVTGTLTLTGTDTLAQYRTALRGVLYHNLAGDDPIGGSRTITFTVNDGTSDSNNATATVAVVAVNDVAQVVAGAAQNYTENAAPVTVDSGLLLSDIDDTQLTGATVTISGNFRSGGRDRLDFTPVGTITGVWNGGTGVLTLSGTDSVANYRTALRSVTYRNLSDDPNQAAGTAVLTRTITFQVNDGSALSAPATATVAVQPVNDAPGLGGGDRYMTAITRITTVDPVANVGDTVASILSTGMTDVDQTGTLQGMVIYDLDDERGPGWQYSLDGGANWQAMGVINPGNSLLLRATDRVRYVSDGADADLAAIHYYAWDQTTGIAGAKVNSNTRGGDTAFSSLDQKATLLVNAAPTLAPAAPTLTGITEDQTTSAGSTVGALLGVSVADLDSGALEGIAVYATGNDTGTWQYSLNGGGSWQAMGAVSSASARLLRTTDLVRFVPDTLNPPNLPAQAATLQYYAWDQSRYAAGNLVDVTSRGAATPFSSSGDQATIAVTAVNDAPVLAAAAPTLPEITHDDTANGGLTIATLVGATISDVDLAPITVEGIAVTVATSAGGGGKWQYSIDAGANWTDVGVVSAAQSLLLRAQDLIRYQPDLLDTNGTASFSYRAWDQTGATLGAEGTKVSTAVTGGTTPFSSVANSASIRINHAPTLTATAQDLTPITEDQTANAGDLVGTLLGGAMADADSGAAQGIAIYAKAQNNGSWQYNIGGGWMSVGTVSTANALLLRDTDRVRFIPDAMNPPVAPATLSFYAWDRTLYSAGTKVSVATRGGTTPFSTTGDQVGISVAAVVDAPVLAPAAPVLTPLTENDLASAGQTLSAILGASVSDVDYSAVEGIAITGIVSGNGAWQYDIGGGWTDLGAPTATNALLLRATDRIRFVPDGQNATSGSFTYRAWDQTSGSAGASADVTVNGGTTAFSAATDTATLTVSAVNDAPVLLPMAPSLTPLTEDDTGNAGDLIFDLLAASVTDVDSGAVEGLAITGLTSGNGSWQYDIGGGWTAVGAVSDASSLLLRSGDRIRFVPDGQNATSASFTFRAWDRSSGSAGAKVNTTVNGGNAAFSSATDTASITVSAQPDAPVLAPAAPTLATLDEDALGNGGETIATLLGGAVSDVDSGALEGLAVTGLNSANGVWEYHIGGGWTAVGAVAETNALLLRASDRIRFVPDGENAATPSVTFRAWDQSVGSAGDRADASVNGGLTAFSAASDTASLTVTAVNDAPVVQAGAAMTYGENAPALAVNGGLLVGDVDDGTILVQATIAITGHYQIGADLLEFTDTGSITGSWDGATGVLTLTGADTVANYQAALNQVTYRNLGDDPSATGTDRTLTFTVHDGLVASAAATGMLQITAVNDDPTVVPALAWSVAEGGDGVLDGAALVIADPDNTPDQVLLTLTALPQYGALTLDGVVLAAGESFTQADVTVGRVRYQHDGSETLLDSFRFTTVDGAGGASGEITAQMTILPVNDAPVITAPGNLTVDEDTGLVITGLSIADADATAGDPLTVTLSASHGTLTLAGLAGLTVTGGANGSDALSVTGTLDALNTALSGLVYQGRPDFNGADGLAIQVGDQGNNGSGGEQWSGAVIGLTVTPVQDIPLAGLDALFTDEDTPLTIDPVAALLANDVDVDDDPLTLVAFTQPDHGQVVQNADGTLTYRADPDFNGSDQFFYTVEDAAGNRSQALVTVVVDPITDAIEARDDQRLSTEDQTLVSGTLIGNDLDPDFLIDAGHNPDFRVIGFTQAQHGVVTLQADGSFTYRPDENFHGTDWFTYILSDGDQRVDQATVTLQVDSINDTPVAGLDTLFTDEDQPLTILPGSSLLANDSDVDGDHLMVIHFTQPSHGRVALNGDGSFTYVPEANFNGVDMFTYTVSDGQGYASTTQATILVGIAPVQDALLAAADAASTREEEWVTVANVLANDRDPDYLADDGRNPALTILGFTSPEHGTVVYNHNGAFLYRPSADFYGVDHFTYMVHTGDGRVDRATVWVRVTGVNDAPRAGESIGDQQVREEQSVRLRLSEGIFVEADREDTLTYSASGLPGWLHFDPATLTFFGQPRRGDAGHLTLSVTATDAAGQSLTRSFRLEVEAAPAHQQPVGKEPNGGQGRGEQRDTTGIALSGTELLTTLTAGQEAASLKGHAVSGTRLLTAAAQGADLDRLQGDHGPSGTRLITATTRADGPETGPAAVRRGGSPESHPATAEPGAPAVIMPADSIQPSAGELSPAPLRPLEEDRPRITAPAPAFTTSHQAGELGGNRTVGGEVDGLIAAGPRTLSRTPVAREASLAAFQTATRQILSSASGAAEPEGSGMTPVENLTRRQGLELRFAGPLPAGKDTVGLGHPVLLGRATPEREVRLDSRGRRGEPAPVPTGRPGLTQQIQTAGSAVHVHRMALLENLQRVIRRG
ncbi:MAG: tandem-95 repeat protein [Magnetococcales bacterium]|nr:tandem-95 repeat protein [Magnetococcales bacterium]